jgi:predicted Rossmann-fold nucleotide-binding protein
MQPDPRENNNDRERQTPPQRADSTAPRYNARESWRIFGIMAEFVEATERLAAIRPAVSIFGSARTPPDHMLLQLTEQIARLLSDSGFAVISGGGPGIMEAANKGAFFGKSPVGVGLNIQLPHGAAGRQPLPGHLADLPALLRAQVHVREVRRGLRGDARRLRHARRAARGDDADPDRKSRKIPIILVHRPFWQGLLDWFRDRLVAEGMINPKTST